MRLKQLRQEDTCIAGTNRVCFNSHVEVGWLRRTIGVSHVLGLSVPTGGRPGNLPGDVLPEAA